MQDTTTIPRREKRLHECVVCKNKFQTREVEPIDTISESLFKAIKAAAPNLDEHGYICLNDLNKIRREYFKQLIKEEKGDLTEVEKAVYEALREHEILSSSELRKTQKRKTFGEKLSDKIAEFGGSWSFIIICIFSLSVWVMWNSRSNYRFDPYPFILLNLFLSCVAALQAPIIMMSQNRQQERDRQHQEQDYKVNLKSEVEIRILNEKIDKLISHQWQRLLEIQEMQMDFMEELNSKRPK